MTPDSLPSRSKWFCDPILLILSGLALQILPCHGLTLYDFGNPSAEEQLYLELINRARADPRAEGLRLAVTTDPSVLYYYGSYGVDLTQMQIEFNLLYPNTDPPTLPPVLPPLAPNAGLTASARGHSTWMLANAIQSHYETNPYNTPWDRMHAAGFFYSGSNASESVYTNANSVWHGHAGFQVDWGSGANGSTYGMQEPRGHRNNTHSTIFREIGVGVVLGTNGSVGPQLVTQDFGTSITNPTLGTGVAYYDINSNNFYDVGEGISGLTVNVDGANITQYCNTAIGGGWVVPVPSTAATRTVTFSGLNINQSVSLIVPESKNAKADLQLTYAPPTITSAATTGAGVSHALTFNPVGGASAYKWNRCTLNDAAPEFCENTTNITSSTTNNYSLTNPNVKAQGNYAFHLENSTGANQSILLNSLYYGQSSPTLSFLSRIRNSTSDEQFKVQIKEEGSDVWQDVFSQSGGSPEGAFSTHNAALSSMTGKTFRVRFLLNFTTGSLWPYSGDAYGWFIDAITFSGVSTQSNNVLQTLAGTSGSFTPSVGTYLMSIAPVISNRDFPASYQILTASNKINASVTLGNLATTYNGSQKNATATTSPVNGLTVTFTYNDSPIAPTNAGSYTVVGTINDPTYQGSATGILVISKAAANVTLGNLTATYNGSQKNATATTSPVTGLTVAFTYNDSPIAPTNAGSYTVVGTINDTNYQGSATGILVISKAAANVTLGNLTATYNGSQKNATATTSPVTGLTVAFTYNGSAIAPTNAGSYTVVGTINDTNYQGSTTGTLVISAPPVILSQPVSTTIKKTTGSTTLSVIASGTGLTYQWYQGTSGTTTTPLGTASSCPVSNLTKSTSYWVRVSNAAALSVDSITSTVNVSTNTVTRSFSSWATEIELANNLAANSIANQPSADYDHDGRSNLLEYAFGSCPHVGNDSAPRMPSDQSTPTHFILRYQRDTSLTDFTMTAQACSDLSTWKSPMETGAPVGFSDTFSTSGTIETHDAKIPKSTGNCFMRVRVTQP